MSQKSTFFLKLNTHVLAILGPKMTFSGLFQSCLIVVQELFRHCFWTLMGLFQLNLQLQRSIYEFGNQDFRSNFGSWYGNFWPFWGSKKSISGLFQSCLRVVQELFRHCFWTLMGLFQLYLQLKRSIYEFGNQDFWSTFGSWYGHFWPFWGPKKIVFWTFSKLFESCSGTV